MTGLARSLWPEASSSTGASCRGRRTTTSSSRTTASRARIARLGDPSNPRSWFARSRARVGDGHRLTAPGIPMLFMGQEFLEDKQWSDNVEQHPELLLHWQGLDDGDRQMHDHLRFTRELVALSWRCPACAASGSASFTSTTQTGYSPFTAGSRARAHDVLVVMHLGTVHRVGYWIGFPGGGEWREVFNSDVYEGWVNPRRRQRRPGCRPARAAARLRPLGGPRPACERHPRLRAVTCWLDCGATSRAGPA